MRSDRPRMWLRHEMDVFEHDPEFQIRFHQWMMTLWLIMTVLVTLGYFFTPGVWLKVSVLYLIVISHYANWATDYDAVSAASAFLHARNAEEKR